MESYSWIDWARYLFEWGQCVVKMGQYIMNEILDNLLTLATVIMALFAGLQCRFNRLLLKNQEIIEQAYVQIITKSDEFKTQGDGRMPIIWTIPFTIQNFGRTPASILQFHFHYEFFPVVRMDEVDMRSPWGLPQVTNVSQRLAPKESITFEKIIPHHLMIQDWGPNDPIGTHKDLRMIGHLIYVNKFEKSCVVHFDLLYRVMNMGDLIQPKFILLRYDIDERRR